MHMDTPLTAEDLLPWLLKLPHDEQLRLARLALHAASGGGRDDQHAYQVAPTTKEEFSIAEDSLTWDGEGWDEF